MDTKTIEKVRNADKVVNLLKSIENRNPVPIRYINPDKYIQHNVSIVDGLEGFKLLLQQLPLNTAKANTVRVFEDGDYVFAHTEYNFFGPKIGFDIFRFEDDKIVEHWDNMQETAQPNPSGHTMIDGSNEVKDLDKTESNKKLVKKFVEDMLMNGKLDRLPEYFNGDNYIQHNPLIPDKLSGLTYTLEKMAKAGITIKYDKIHKVLGQGNFVLVVSEGHMADKYSSFYDLFRVENGKIAEHWDTIETIPGMSKWENYNGKF